MKPIREMGAGEFKAKCLRVLDEVATTRRDVVITKRGRPVARIVPVEPDTEGPLHGLIVEQGDLVSPIDVD
jgi:prevent-host-death family protein